MAVIKYKYSTYGTWGNYCSLEFAFDENAKCEKPLSLDKGSSQV